MSAPVKKLPSECCGRCCWGSDVVALDGALGARVDAEGMCARTRVFRVRYAREPVELRTLAMFTLRLDALQDFANTKLTVQVDLMYSVECPSDMCAMGRGGHAGAEGHSLARARD